MPFNRLDTIHNTDVVVVFFSVLENEDASDWDYQLETIAMAEAITRLAFGA